MVHTKVFVGNLSFKTKADELAAEFSAAGRVVSANIITRGPRSLGYGFVELESEEEAQKAVALLNKKSVDGREINVELAKPRDEARIAERRAARGPPRQRRGGPRRRGVGGDRGAPPPHQQGGENAPLNNAPPQQGADQGGPPQQQGGAPGSPIQRGFRRRYRPSGRGGGGGGGDRDRGDRGERGPRGGPQGEGQPPLDQGNSPQGGGGLRGRRRFGNRPRDLSNRTPSNTTLFVANLPFSMNDADLANLFKDHKISKAHIVRAWNGRSKGFGFLEFPGEEDQKAALTACEKLVVENRELVLKIALTAPERSNNNNNNAGNNNNNANNANAGNIPPPTPEGGKPTN